MGHSGSDFKVLSEIWPLFFDVYTNKNEVFWKINRKVFPWIHFAVSLNLYTYSINQMEDKVLVLYTTFNKYIINKRGISLKKSIQCYLFIFEGIHKEFIKHISIDLQSNVLGNLEEKCTFNIKEIYSLFSNTASFKNNLGRIPHFSHAYRQCIIVGN